ncbi:hypothetical protein [Catellatospora sp. IY07-71]|uniref:hypothetical protein n=1 Tax=Catellatospora sp. IY07-71 TaxID=2728827 RepID=UPI001BB3578A|nr:hypothetical protein [Catellatospora sp. IY07-71]
MRLRLAFAAVLAALASVLVAPAAAHAAPDPLACSAIGSYSRVGSGDTFWLIGSADGYRYWQVADAVSNHYRRSYVVRCDGATIVSAADLTVTSTSGARCGTASDSTYQYAGTRMALAPLESFPGWVIETDYRYWRVNRWVSFGWYGFWMYDHSELAACLAP